MRNSNDSEAFLNLFPVGKERELLTRIYCDSEDLDIFPKMCLNISIFVKNENKNWSTFVFCAYKENMLRIYYTEREKIWCEKNHLQIICHLRHDI